MRCIPQAEKAVTPPPSGWNWPFLSSFVDPALFLSSLVSSMV